MMFGKRIVGAENAFEKVRLGSLERSNEGLFQQGPRNPMARPTFTSPYTTPLINLKAKFRGGSMWKLVREALNFI